MWGPAGVVDVDPPFAWNCQVVAGAGVVENVRQLYSDMHSYLAGQPHVMHNQHPIEVPEDALSHGLLNCELTVCQWISFDRLGSYAARCANSLLLRLVGWAASAAPHHHVLAREATPSLLSRSSSLHLVTMMELCFSLITPGNV